MRQKRSRNRRMLLLAMVALIVFSLVIGECILLIGPIQ